MSGVTRQEKLKGVIHRQSSSLSDQRSGIAKCGEGLSYNMRKVPTISAEPTGADVTCKRCNHLHNTGGGR